LSLSGSSTTSGETRGLITSTRTGHVVIHQRESHPPPLSHRCGPPSGSGAALARDDQQASSSRPLLLDESSSPMVHGRRATHLRLERAREAQRPGDSGMDFPPDWTPDRGSRVSGSCCPMDTGLGGLFGPRPRPLTMRVRERGRAQAGRKVGGGQEVDSEGGLGGPGDRESEKEQQSNVGGARVGGRGVTWWRCAVSVGLALGSG
jgi:hypothetical protein